MLDDDLNTLKTGFGCDNLDGIEARIRTTIAKDERTTRDRNFIVAWQAAAVVSMICASLVIGNLPTFRSRSSQLDAFSMQGIPAPSTLLFKD